MEMKHMLCLILATVLVLGSFGSVSHAKCVSYFSEDDFPQPVKYTDVPLYNQLDYDNTPYGDYGTVATHGCGVTCLAMVTSYLRNEAYLPSEAAKDFGAYNTHNGSLWRLFEESAEPLGLKVSDRTWDQEEVMAALENGQVVVSLQSTGLFTGGGHYIVLTGLTEEGNILVNDPNGRNYAKSETLENGFQNGFSTAQIFAAGGPFWIYEKKVGPSNETTQITQASDAITHTI